MEESINEPKLRVFLWTAPRSLATVLTKCMSFAEGIQIIKEPIAAAHVAGPECNAPNDDELKKTLNEGIPDVPVPIAGRVESSFDDSIATFKWVKEMLESPFPGKSFVFVHDQAFAVRSNDNIPRGFRHTFLIRNPYRQFPSWKKAMVKLIPSFIDKPFSDMPRYVVPAKFGYGELFDLMTHVQENLGQAPIVIDADDLQANPASVLRQYFHLLGLEFKESMLQWEAGDKIADTWIGSKSFVQGNKMGEGGYYEDALKSSAFHPPGELPSRNQVDPDLLPLIDQCMPLYEKMYSMRIRP